MVHGRRRLLRNLWASLAVLVAVGIIGLGLPLINALLPAARPVSASEAYSVAAGVSVRPPHGASVDVAKTQPGPHQGAVLFVVGSVRYAVVVTRYTGTLVGAAERLRTKITGTRGYQIAGGETTVMTAQGITGREGNYASADRVGRYAVFVDRGLSVEVTVAGSGLDLPRALPSVSASIDSLTFRTAS